MNHHDEKGKLAPAQSKIAKKMGKIEAVRSRQPSHGEKGWSGVEKSGGYRKALARNMNPARSR